MKILVIGYGNRSRGDDGAGWAVIEQLEQLKLPEVELLTAHQLQIDLAETIGHYDTVIFVDAFVPNGITHVSRRVVEPRLRAHAVVHYLTPSDLLAICGSLYGVEPGGILFSIPAQNMDFGTRLSQKTDQGIHAVVAEITKLVEVMHGTTCTASNNTEARQRNA